MRSAEQTRLPLQWPRLSLTHNLNDEFVRVDGHDVYRTTSANLAMVANELTQLL